MRDIYVSTVLRATGSRDITGYLYRIRWPSREVIDRTPIPLRSEQCLWGARGGNRGGRGVACHGGKVYMATATSILMYDEDLRYAGALDHPFIAGCHEILVDDVGVTATSTLHDALIKIGHDGTALFEWWGSQSPAMQSHFGYTGRTLAHDPASFSRWSDEEHGAYANDERLHLNAVAQRGDELFVLSNRRKAIIRIHPGPERVVVCDDDLLSPHNLLLLADGSFVVNNTGRQQIKVYSPEGRCVDSVNTPLYPADGSSQFSVAGWQRGMGRLGEGRLLCGTSPATLFEVDIHSGQVGGVLPLDDDVRHCIHGIGCAV